MTIVFAGSIGRFPVGGPAWVHMQYLLGLRALGHDVSLPCSTRRWRDAGGSTMTGAPAVTVAIPTFCRAGLLRSALGSALAQDYAALAVLVVDNASTDETEAVVRAVADARVRYVRHPANLGLFPNWKRALDLSSTPYVAILQDDNLLLPGFVRRSVDVLETQPGAGFSFSFARAIDAEGRPLHRLDASGPPRGGLMRGVDYLHRIVAGENVIIRDSTVLLRRSAVVAVGGFDNPHADNSIDLNLFLRLADRFDIACIPEELAEVRLHAAQDSDTTFRAGALGILAKLGERIDAAAFLMRSARAGDPAYREWLAERLLHINLLRSEVVAGCVPGLKKSTGVRWEQVRHDLRRVVPAGSSFVLVDANEWDPDVLPGCVAVPFLERNGGYWGPPADDDEAIRELERLRGAGAKAIVWGWPAFWWLDFYTGFREYLYATYGCVLRNSRVLVFDLSHARGRGTPAGPAGWMGGEPWA